MPRSRKRRRKDARSPKDVNARAVRLERGPVVFRLSGVVVEQPSPVAESPRPEHSLASLLPDVSPLPGAPRVSIASSRARAPLPGEPGKALAFVLERDGVRVVAHRADGTAPRVAPGWAKNWAPDVRLDLHGVRTRELERKITLAIRECVQRRARRLLVIHGKGIHSAGGEGVLSEAVLDSLTNRRHALHVRAFCTAPARLGGHGALAVEIDVDAVLRRT
jgi:hypothetical protein